MKRFRDITTRSLFAALFTVLVNMLAGGCCSIVAHSGDAKILTCWQLMRSPGMQMFYMELPTINISLAGTNIFRVRNLPKHLKGQFVYSLSMKVPDSETFPSAQPPWKEAQITLALRNLDGTEAFKQTFSFEINTNQYGQRATGWNVDWGLGLNHPAPIEDSSFDIVVVVDHPSLRRTDQISLDGYAYIHKPQDY